MELSSTAGGKNPPAPGLSPARPRDRHLPVRSSHDALWSMSPKRLVSCFLYMYIYNYVLVGKQSFMSSLRDAGI